MATLLVERLISDSRLSLTNTGARGIEKFLVTNATRGQQHSKALQVCPAVGDAHPENATLPTPLFVEMLESAPVPGNNSNIHVTATYAPDSLKTRLPSLTGPCTLESRVIITQKEFFTNKDGVTMFVNATRNGKVLQPQSVKALVPFPMTYLTFRRYEPRDRGLESLQPYIGCVNSAAWIVAGKVNYQKLRSVLCTGITLTEDGDAVLMSYEFQAFGLNVVPNQTSIWDQFEYYKDPITKEILTNSTPGVTLTSTPASTTTVPSFRVLGELDFLGLNLH